MIQLHRLEGFYWVARTGGYARAARAFPYPITQPAVHQQVKKLETDLGLSLFEHVTKEGMKLTPAGTRLFEFVSPFFAGLPAIVRSLEEGEYGGEIELAVAALALRSILPAWINRVHRAHPNVRIHMREAPDLDLNILRRGEVDMVIDYFPEIPDDCASLKVGTMRPFLVVPRTRTAPSTKSMQLSDCAGETFIAYSSHTLAYELQMQALAMHGIKPPVIHTASGADSILGFVEAGLGYSLIPSFDSAGPKSRNLRAFPLKSPDVEYAVYAVWRKDTPENPVLDALLEEAPK
ncbi:MAG: DNA-binding transcriptional LysR family regulator [Planctomycetota bacterium]|jgi:DNA-binding transcriptional LysR family regulator